MVLEERKVAVAFFAADAHIPDRAGVPDFFSYIIITGGAGKVTL